MKRPPLAQQRVRTRAMFLFESALISVYLRRLFLLFSVPLSGRCFSSIVSFALTCPACPGVAAGRSRGFAANPPLCSCLSDVGDDVRSRRFFAFLRSWCKLLSFLTSPGGPIPHAGAREKHSPDFLLIRLIRHFPFYFHCFPDGHFVLCCDFCAAGKCICPAEQGGAGRNSPERPTDDQPIANRRQRAGDGLRLS